MSRAGLRRTCWAFTAAVLLLALAGVGLAEAQGPTRKPNILVIWGDDIGWQNVSAYGMGTMGYTTPHIDSLGMEGIRFTDHYAQPSCTAGRAAFITGQYPIRSGMTTVGVPGDKLGLQAASPSLGEVMKKAGYGTGHFGKNHLGDRNEHLPTAHGFDEFFGNLYHLNTQEQQEYRDYQAFAKAYPGGPEAFAKKFGTRGVLHSFASSTDDPTEDPRFGRVGRQTIKDTGPLTMERMKDFDASEVIPKAIAFMQSSQKETKPFFVWLNTSRMHLYSRLNDKWRYAAAKYTHDEDYHGSGMLQHDHDVGLVLDFLKKSGLDQNTIVWYSTDNGPEHSSWPHGATTPFRGEKMTAYEGGVRVLSMLRWPGRRQAGAGAQRHPGAYGHVHYPGRRGRRAGRRRGDEKREEAVHRRCEQPRLLDRQVARERPQRFPLLLRRQAGRHPHGPVEVPLLNPGTLLRQSDCQGGAAGVQPA
jgi:arylsulfatase A-like enzyme